MIQSLINTCEFLEWASRIATVIGLFVMLIAFIALPFAFVFDDWAFFVWSSAIGLGLSFVGFLVGITMFLMQCLLEDLR